MASKKIPFYPYGTPRDILPPCPPHSASKTFTLLALSAFAVKWTDDTKTAVVQLTRETFNQMRKRLRGAPLAVAVKRERLNPPDYHVPLFMTSYPPLGQESDAKERQERLWLNAKQF
jgi:hypothetical protein